MAQRFPPGPGPGPAPGPAPGVGPAMPPQPRYSPAPAPPSAPGVGVPRQYPGPGPGVGPGVGGVGPGPGPNFPQQRSGFTPPPMSGPGGGPGGGGGPGMLPRPAGGYVGAPPRPGPPPPPPAGPPGGKRPPDNRSPMPQSQKPYVYAYDQYQQPVPPKKKKKLADKILPQKVRDLVPESQAYMDLLAFERKLDATIMRKRLDIQEALKRPMKQKRKLRIFISNTFYPGVNDNSVASWELRVEGRLLEDTKNDPNKVKRKFSSFFKSLVIELDKELYGPDNHLVEWHRTITTQETDGFQLLDYQPLQFKLDQRLARLLGVHTQTRPVIIAALRQYIIVWVQVKRPGYKNVRCTILLLLDYQPLQFKLDQRLARLLGVHTQTRPVIIAALRQYIIVWVQVKRPGYKNVRCTILLLLDYQPLQFKLDQRLARLLGVHTQTRPVIIAVLRQYIIVWVQVKRPGYKNVRCTILLLLDYQPLQFKLDQRLARLLGVHTQTRPVIIAVLRQYIIVWVQVKRPGYKNVRCTILLLLDYQPLQFKLDQRLARLLGVHTQTRPVIIAALRQYIIVWVQVKRPGYKNVRCTILLLLDYQPLQFKLDQRLARLLGVHTQTRPVIIAALRQYIIVWVQVKRPGYKNVRCTILLLLDYQPLQFKLDQRLARLLGVHTQTRPVIIAVLRQYIIVWVQVKRPGYKNVRCTILLLLDYQPLQFKLDQRLARLLGVHTQTRPVIIAVLRQYIIVWVQVKRPGYKNVRCTILLLLDYQPLQFKLDQRLARLLGVHTQTRPVIIAVLRQYIILWVQVKRPGYKNVRCTILLLLDYQPLQFKLDQRLARLLGVHTQTRPVIIAALWQYIKTHKLQDAHEREYIACDKYLEQIFSCQRMKFAEIPQRLNPLLHPPDPIVINHVIGVEGGAEAKQTACYDIDVEVDDTLKTQMNNFLLSTANQQEIQGLDTKIHETVDTINQLKTNREFFLSFSKDPQQFIQKWLVSQTRDLKTMNDVVGNPEEERRAAFYQQAWSTEGVARYFHAKVQQKRTELDSALGLRNP